MGCRRPRGRSSHGNRRCQHAAGQQRRDLLPANPATQSPTTPAPMAAPPTPAPPTKGITSSHAPHHSLPCSARAPTAPRRRKAPRRRADLTAANRIPHLVSRTAVSRSVIRRTVHPPLKHRIRSRPLGGLAAKARVLAIPTVSSTPQSRPLRSPAATSRSQPLKPREPQTPLSAPARQPPPPLTWVRLLAAHGTRTPLSRRPASPPPSACLASGACSRSTTLPKDRSSNPAVRRREPGNTSHTRFHVSLGGSLHLEGAIARRSPPHPSLTRPTRHPMFPATDGWP